ncbi:broad specificity phosphatase PhoE [Paenibacillus sp. V4I3]|nr:broad specificity phosphatase PhoE [Paenibacillus sp. V4I3]
MKFTIPVLTLCHGGAQRMLVELANGLTRRGHQVCLLMPSGSIVEYEIEAQVLHTNQHRFT